MECIKNRIITMLKKMVLKFEAYQLNKYTYGNEKKDCCTIIPLDWLEKSEMNDLLKMENIQIVQETIKELNEKFNNMLSIDTIIHNNHISIYIKRG